jgi:predicted RNA-binding protein with RPS1 domain
VQLELIEQHLLGFIHLSLVFKQYVEEVLDDGSVIHY